jgi:hypothetical protein
MCNKCRGGNYSFASDGALQFLGQKSNYAVNAEGMGLTAENK